MHKLREIYRGNYSKTVGEVNFCQTLV